MNSKDQMLMKTLHKFFNNKDNFNILNNIINKKSKISLRVIDWFVTNYCKKKNIIYQIKKNNMIEYFNVYLNYKDQLKAYQKKQFDPFRRKNKNEDNFIDFNGLITTVGQLNFFRWIIKKKIINYITDNIEEIENDMNLSNKIKHKTSKKRHQLSLSATRTVTKQYVKHTITFN